MGNPNKRPACYLPEQEMSPLLLQSQTGETVPKRDFPPSVGQRAAICFSSNPSDLEGPINKSGKIKSYTDCTHITETGVVPKHDIAMCPPILLQPIPHLLFLNNGQLHHPSLQILWLQA